MAREKGAGHGVKAMTAMLGGDAAPFTPFAPPFLRDGDRVVSQVANILDYLGPKLGLAPKEDKLRRFVLGLQLTITDFVAEVHDTHHPLSTGLYYEDQKAAAKKRATGFLDERVPKYLGYFEKAFAANPAGPSHIVGKALTTVDLSLFQVWAGMTYAFPRAFADASTHYPKLAALVQSVGERPNIAPTSPPIAASRSTNPAFSATIRNWTVQRRRQRASSPGAPSGRSSPSGEHVLVVFRLRLRHFADMGARPLLERVDGGGERFTQRGQRIFDRDRRGRNDFPATSPSRSRAFSVCDNIFCVTPR